MFLPRFTRWKKSDGKFDFQLYLQYREYRAALGAAIVQTLAGLREPVIAIALDGALEDVLAAAVRAAPGSPWPFDPALAQRVGEAVTDAANPLVARAQKFAILTTPAIRRTRNCRSA